MSNLSNVCVPIWIQSPPSIGFVIDAVSTNPVVVEPPNPSTLTQQWNVCFPSGPLGGLIVFVNVGNGQALAVVNGMVTTVPLSQVGGANQVGYWSLGGDEGSNGFPGYVTIRPASNTAQNLNIQGDGPYSQGTPVILWGYEPEANEVWALPPVGQ